jgi:AcrR family transcriptional regulator
MAQGVLPRIDPRIRRTRQLLLKALDKLLQTKEFDEVSVQDIADVATVNRATFYDHFTDKFALLECMVQGRFEELLAVRKVQFDATCASALKAIVLALCECVTWMQGPGGERQLEPPMESAIIAVVRRVLLDGLKQQPHENVITPGIMAAAASWAIYGAVKEWAQTPDKCAEEEIANAVTLLVTPLLQVTHGNDIRPA